MIAGSIPTPAHLFAAARAKAAALAAEVDRLRAGIAHDVAAARAGAMPAIGEGYWERLHAAELRLATARALAECFAEAMAEEAGRAERPTGTGEDPEEAGASGAPPDGKHRFPSRERPRPEAEGRDAERPVLDSVDAVFEALGGRAEARRRFGHSRQVLNTWAQRGIPPRWADFTRALLPGFDIDGQVFGMVRVRSAPPGPTKRDAFREHEARADASERRDAEPQAVAEAGEKQRA